MFEYSEAKTLGLARGIGVGPSPPTRWGERREARGLTRAMCVAPGGMCCRFDDANIALKQQSQANVDPATPATAVAGGVY